MSRPQRGLQPETNQGIDWNLYRIFLTVFQTGSLSAAGRVLGISAATVGRQIEGLEQGLGLVLFTRSPGGLDATSEAHDLTAHAKAMAAAADALARSAGGSLGGLNGSVRITASEFVGAEILPELLHGFHDRYPNLALEIVLNNRTEDLVRRDADIAVRMSEPLQQSLWRKRLGEIQIGLYAHQSYVQKRGLPTSVEALSGHTLIGYDRDLFAQRMAAAAGLEVHRELFTLRSDSDLAQLALLRAGCGIAGCQVKIAERDAQLIPVLPQQIRFLLPVWLVMHRDQRRVPRIRHAFDYLSAALLGFLGPRQTRGRMASPVHPSGE